MVFDVDFRRNILYEDQGWQDNATELYDKVIFFSSKEHAYSVWTTSIMG